jgi:paraquat-inducible protein A
MTTRRAINPANQPETQHSLNDLYPRELLWVLIAWLLSASLSLTALWLPLMHTERLVFWETSYSVWTGIVSLWEQRQFGLAVVLFFFSIVFPVAKLIAVALVCYWRLPAKQRARLLDWLAILGKWSMLDVFIVAVLIVLVKLGPVVRVEPRLGVYVFAAAILLSMLTTMYVERLSRHAAS